MFCDDIIVNDRSKPEYTHSFRQKPTDKRLLGEQFFPEKAARLFWGVR